MLFGLGYSFERLSAPAHNIHFGGHDVCQYRTAGDHAEQTLLWQPTRMTRATLEFPAGARPNTFFAV